MKVESNMKNGDIIRYDIPDSLSEDIENMGSSLAKIAKGRAEIEERTNDLIREVAELAEMMNVSVPIPEKLDIIDTEVYELNSQLELKSGIIAPKMTKPFPSLTWEEIIFSSISGLIAVAIDVIFVGTPEVVKIYKGGENFSGSRLTALLRKTDGGKVAQWLSDKCKVPYDISLKTGVLTPNNHRLRSLAHDPFFGLFFAVVDIIMGTTTCIDNNGHLTILINDRSYPPYEKILAVFYYIGHIISDMFTTRGIPVPGFFLTQFFTGNGSDTSLAKKAEEMYHNGYDLRHTVSMSVPVIAKNLLIDGYLALTRNKSNQFVITAEREYAEIAEKVRKEKMLFLSDAIAASGNAVKFFAPPSCANPCSLNAVQWFALVRDCISMAHINLTNRTTETLIVQRKEINQKWAELLGE